MQDVDDQRFMTLKELRHKFHQDLDAIHGKNEVDSFFWLLVEHFLNFRPIDITLNPNYQVYDESQKHFIEAIDRLKQEEPIQYIIGETEFYGLLFKVSSKVLIPRPETEELVEWMLKDNPTTTQQQLTVLDIGTGSGCIAIALAKHLPNAKVYALDISPKALEVAKENALLNKVDVEFIEKNILTSSHYELISASRKFDIIVSNPPYVRKLEKSTMKSNVLKYEPHLALFVEDNDPLLFYKAICKIAVHNLKPNGMLYFEINQYLGAELKQLLTKFDFNSVELRKDLFGNNRMLKAKNHE